MYGEIKQLYKLRSKIVHGNAAPGKGTITRETLAITAKQSFVPRSQFFKLLSITIQVLNSVLACPKFLEFLHVKGNEEKQSEALDKYFLDLLLGGAA